MEHRLARSDVHRLPELRSRRVGVAPCSKRDAHVLVKHGASWVSRETGATDRQRVVDSPLVQVERA
jgi:hypothetical protein